MTFFLNSAVFAAGLIAGSFFNVLIWRIPRGESIVFPSSHCTRCGTQILAWQNIPVISFLFLRGRCASCKEPIGTIYPLIELATGVAAVAFFNCVGHVHSLGAQWWSCIPFFVKMLSLLIIIPVTVIDLRHYIIPDLITLTGLIAGFAVAWIPGDTTPLQSIAGIAAGGGSLFIIGWIGTILFKKGDAMGGGDIKLMAFAGAVWGPQVALMTILFGAFLGAVSGIVLLLLKRLDSDHRIPFGPFLGVGLWIAVLAGEKLVTAYLNVMGNLLVHQRIY